MSVQEFEFNSLCAKFMGWEYIDKDSHPYAYANYGWWKANTYHPEIDAYKNENFIGFNHNLLFHSDWNWIMMIVDEINKKFETEDYYGIMIEIRTDYVTIDYDEFRDKIHFYDKKADGEFRKQSLIQILHNFLKYYYEKN